MLYSNGNKGQWKETIGEVLHQVKQLKDKCEGIIDIFCGENYHKESKSLTHGIVIIAKNIETIEEDGLEFDFKDLQ